MTIKAWEKVRGRLEKGVEDSIPFYIEGFKEHIAKGKLQKGYHVIIVEEFFSEFTLENLKFMKMEFGDFI